MLVELRISNLALIEEAELLSGPGFNVLTGETGAGKSILISALGLLVGERAAAEQVGQSSTKNGKSEGAARALSKALSTSPKRRKSPNICANKAFPLKTSNCSWCAKSRRAKARGRSRVRINGRLATAATLRELGTLLVDLHGQHEHQLLLNPESHLGFLDAYGDAKHQQLRDDVAQKFETWHATQRRLDELTRSEQQRAQRLDMLKFQAEEIDATAPKAGEDEQLSEERARLMNAEKLREAAALCRDLLSGGDEPGALELARGALKAARELEEFDKSVSAWAQEIESAIYELEDAATEARSYADSLDADPLRLEEIEARLHRLNRLKRKYGDTLQGVLSHRAQIAGELENLSVSEEELADLRAQRPARASRFFWKPPNRLSQSRQQVAQAFRRDRR